MNVNGREQGSESTSKESNMALWAISIGHTFTHWYPATFYVVLPFLGKALGLSYTQIAMIITVRQLVSTIANVPAGAIVDIIGKRSLLMVISLMWVGIPYFFMGFTANYFAILVCMALIGAGNNLWHPSAITEITRRFSTRRGWAIGVHATAANLGDAIAPLAMGLLMSTLLTWRQVLMINFIPGMVVGLILWRVFSTAEFNAPLNGKATTGKKGASEGLGLKSYLAGIKALLQNRSLLLLSCASGMRSMTQNGLMIFLPLYYANVMGLSPALVGTYMAVLQFAGMAASPLSGYISDRSGRKRVVTTGLTMTSLSIVLFVALRIEWLFIVYLAVLGFFLFSLRPVLFAWTTEATPAEYSGTTVSILFGVQAAFSSLSPIIGGLIADQWGIIYTFYFVAATVLLANAIVYFIPDSHNPKSTAPAVSS